MDNKKEEKTNEEKQRVKINTYTKVLVTVITAVCLIDLQLSYLLAFLDKMQIAETLSDRICTTILGVAFVYMIRAYFDTKAEKKSELQTLEQDSEIIKEHLIEKFKEICTNSEIDLPEDFFDFLSKCTDSEENVSEEESNKLGYAFTWLKGKVNHADSVESSEVNESTES